MYTEHCSQCPLRGKADVNCGAGRKDAPFMVVVDAPSARPDSYNRLMPKSAASLFAKTAQGERFGRDDFYFYPQVRCAYDPDAYTTKEKTFIRKCCRPHFLAMVDEIKPEVVIPLGADACAQVSGRPVKIMKVRGLPTVSEELNTPVLPMLNPLLPVIYPQHQPVFASDFATLGRLANNDYDVTKTGMVMVGDYEYIDDLEFLVREGAPTLGYDTEGTGLRWYAPDAKILTMQFCIEPGKAYMLPWDHPDRPQSARAKARLKRQLTQLLNNERTLVVGQNAKFDRVYTQALTGIYYPIGGDTLMLATLLDENATSKSLADLVKRFVPEMAGYSDHFDANVDKGQMIKLPLDDEFLNYGCGDAEAAYRLHEVLHPMVAEDAKLLAHYDRVTLPGLNAFANIEQRGLVIKSDVIEAFETYMADLVATMRSDLLAAVPAGIKRMHVEAQRAKHKSKPIEEILSFSRKEFVLDWLFYHKQGLRLKPKVYTKTTDKLDKERRVPSTSTKHHLPYFFEDYPVTRDLAAYIKSERILSTNVRGFRSKYVVDGMCRPVYHLHKAVTGRTSSEDPNGQNFPKRGPVAKEYRKLFGCPPGYFVLEADLSQAELRIAADMACDPTMLEIYRSGGDIHRATAIIVLGVSERAFAALPPEVQKDARTKAKAVNFGFLYGMSWRTFIAYAKTDYGVDFTEREAQRIRTAFFAKYSHLPEWHAKMRAFAHANGFVRSYDGRIRHLPMIHSKEDSIRADAERQAINSPVQELGSSMGVMACGRMDAEIDPQYIELVGFVHDALYAYVPMQYLEWGAKTLRWYMESNPLEQWFGRRMKLPIVADVAFGVDFSGVLEMGAFDIPSNGLVTVGDYDFEGLLASQKVRPDLIIPKQEIPPNHGRRMRLSTQ